MKRILFFILISFITINIFAEELWNGFTENMTIEEVKRIGKSKFGVNPRDITNNYEDRLNSTFDAPIIKLNPYNVDLEKGNIYYNSEFISYPDKVIGFRSTDPVYNQETYKTWSNIHFFFVNNKLYAVEVRWSLSFTDIASPSIGKYGNDYKSEIVTHTPVNYWEAPKKVSFYRWSKENFEIFLANESDLNYDHGNPLYIISKKGILESQNKKNQKDKEKLKEKEQSQEILKNGIVF